MSRARRFTRQELEAMSVALYTLAEQIGVDPDSFDVEQDAVESALAKVWERQKNLPNS